MNLNKLIVLDLANKMGLDIPKTFIINDKKTPYKSIRGKLINYKNGK
jgi:glutathione synthase/RimK-type ligase-like ATP-grasp enzyme